MLFCTEICHYGAPGMSLGQMRSRILFFFPSFFLFLEEQNFNLALLEFRRRQLHVASPGTGRRGRCLPLRCGAPGPADGARAPGWRIRAGVGGAGGRRPETIEKAGIHTLAAALPRSQEIMK